MHITALIPSHNEENNIASAIKSLFNQSRQPDKIIVIADNCTDATIEIAQSMGVEVVKTINNIHKKAGALNQVLDNMLDESGGILVMDADSELDSTFIECAEKYLYKHKKIGGVGGTFRGKTGGGFVGTLQRNEYARYARDTRRKKGKVLVLTGTATLFPISSLRAVVSARMSGRLPGGPHVYDTKVLTEDNELSLALKHLGYTIISPKECTLTTEVMETWRDLAKQRLRWKRGAIENLADYGFTKITAEYWFRQVLTFIGVLVTLVYVTTLSYSLATGTFQLRSFWLIVTAIFMIERMVTVNSRGPGQMALASTIVIEMVFDIFLQVVHLKALFDSVLKRKKDW